MFHLIPCSEKQENAKSSDYASPSGAENDLELHFSTAAGQAGFILGLLYNPGITLTLLEEFSLNWYVDGPKDKNLTLGMQYTVIQET